MKNNSLVGKKVFITDRESWFYGSWGIIISYDGEYYHVLDAGGETTPIFTREQFKVKRNKNKSQ